MLHILSLKYFLEFSWMGNPLILYVTTQFIFVENYWCRISVYFVRDRKKGSDEMSIRYGTLVLHLNAIIDSPPSIIYCELCIVESPNDWHSKTIVCSSLCHRPTDDKDKHYFYWIYYFLWSQHFENINFQSCTSIVCSI